MKQRGRIVCPDGIIPNKTQPGTIDDIMVNCLYDPRELPAVIGDVNIGVRSVYVWPAWKWDARPLKVYWQDGVYYGRRGELCE
jgi:hypothetical protein